MVGKRYCKYDKDIVVKFDRRQEHSGRIVIKPYEGPRMIECYTPHKCKTCGWNPEVEQARKEALRAKMGAEVKE